MHQRIHKGVRPFHCSPCGVFFRQKAHLQKHQKTQGHLQATDVFEKKKRDGLLTPEEAAGQKNNGDEERESIKSEDSLSASNSSLTHSNIQSPTPMTSNSDQYATPSSTVTHRYGVEDENSPSPTTSSRSDSRCKSSPKRKQYKPQHHLAQQDESEPEGEDDDAEVDDDEEELDVVTMAEADTSDDTVRAFIDYNDTTHGYDCRQCAFASHELSVIKDHVKEEHMTIREEKFRCQECQISFSKEFNLRIHNRKHETSSQFLPCDHCEQVFKVPNKLIKHMEGVHSVCPNCGDKQDDKATLIRHLEEAHNENRNKGFHSNLMQFTPLNHLTPPTNLKSPGPGPNLVNDRAEKRRKVDSLAETILQKKQSSMLTNVMNGNDTKNIGALQQPFGTDFANNFIKRRKMGSLSPIRRNPLPTATFPSLMHLQPELPRHPEGINALVNHLNSKMNHDLVRHQKNENNNVLSMAPQIKLPPTIRLPTHPVQGLTPPSSPSPRSTTGMNGHHMHHQPGRIRGEVSVTILHNQNGQHSDDSGEDESEEPGCLDLSIGKRRRDSSHDEEDRHITTTGNVLPPSREQLAELYNRLPFGAGGIQGGNSAFPGFPLPLIGGIIPPPPPGTDPALTEHILKLTAGLQRPPMSTIPGRNLQQPPASLSQAPGSVVPSLPLGPPGIAPASVQGVQPSSLSSPYTNVLSAMLGHVPVGSLQPAFPGLMPLPGVQRGLPAQQGIVSEDNNSSDDGKEDSQGMYNGEEKLCIYLFFIYIYIICHILISNFTCRSSQPPFTGICV